jgi:hypothetical protein
MIPQGSWIESAKNYKFENNILSAELKDLNGNFILDSIEIIPNTSYSNINGKFIPDTEKYFKEILNNSHLDIRYGKENLSLIEIQNSLNYLLIEFMKHCKEIKIKPILMYGGLLGYYFNNKLLPWDDDIDLILLENDINKLKPKIFDKFIIEVNSFAYKNIQDANNKINARIISTDNGVFIDITYFYYNEDMLICQDGNQFNIEDILPIKIGRLNNIDIYIPNNIENCLIQKYSEKCLEITENYNDNWIFRTENKEWIRKN